MKKRDCIFIIMSVFLILFAACGSGEEASAPLPTMAPKNTPTATVAPMPMTLPTRYAVPTVTPTPSPVPRQERPQRQPVGAETPAPTVTPENTLPPTSTPMPTCTPICTPAPTGTPIPTPVPEDYGDKLFVFDREYTDEWGWIEVCFLLKDKEGNPLPGEWCELVVDEEDVMIKSPMVVDYYNTVQFAVTDEEGKVEFIILEQREDGDRELNLTISTYNSRHTEKIYCVDPVRTVPAKPEVTVELKEYIKLSWEWDFDARQYYVERRVNDGEYELVESRFTYSSTWYVDDDIIPRNTYHYRVYGGNHVGTGEVCEIDIPFYVPKAY